MQFTLPLLASFVEYLQENMLFFILIAVCVVAIIILIVLIAAAVKQGKQRRAEETEAPAAQETEEAQESEPEEAPAAQEGKEEPVVEEAKEEPAKQETAEKTEPVAEEAKGKPVKQPKTEKAEPAVKQNKTEPKAAKPAEEKKSAMAGKWIITRLVQTDGQGEVKEETFFFALKATNGVSMITSEEYTTQRGAIQGIETFKTNIANDNFRISVSKKGKFIVKLLNAQASILTQGETYPSRSAAQNAIASIKRFASTAVLVEEVQTVSVPYSEAVADKSYSAGTKGKWVVKEARSKDGDEVSYYFELRANNGQLLFTSEEYTSLAGIKAGMKTHVSNIAAGNIAAVITRNGDYMLKIFKGNGQLLCLGEHYADKQLCLNAIESVKHFAAATELPEEPTVEEDDE